MKAKILSSILSSIFLLTLSFTFFGCGDKKSNPVQPTNQSTTASLTPDKTSGTAPLNVTFTIGYTDPEGKAGTYSLDYGDETGTATGSINSGATTTVSHTYNSQGNYTANLTVTNNEGATDIKNVTINVPSNKILFAIIETTEGIIKLKLYDTETPKTVANFVELAEGQKEWIDPKTGQKIKEKFYDGLIFHRVIPDFMIQGGCPKGDGTGGPGYTFEDEFVDNLKFDRAGLLAMVNRGPNTNGSQFFITVTKTEWLNNRHTIFGEVVEGYDAVLKISQVERDNRDKPLKDVIIKSIKIERVERELNL